MTVATLPVEFIEGLLVQKVDKTRYTVAMTKRNDISVGYYQ
jgi:hypothetical protein